MSAPWSRLREKFRTDRRCDESSCRDRSDTSADAEVEPPDRAEIGRAAWRYLHAMAAEHPEKASELDESAAQAWIAAFIQNYPCAHCATHFVDVCEALPPDTSSRRAYSVWWCEAHNKVNEHLMQEKRSCIPEKLIEAGRKGLTLDDE
ncbi:unnamed protein product [Effrenium voratum]|nr:unnamed protein product [Effrenium voratum]|mmetsp:Transcript_13249/g.31387  ORF Transcript_13249/g.31387 Transcript_13249/m.31387 type:complete len:148 (-) Transcript_13249:9-452(-)